MRIMRIDKCSVNSGEGFRTVIWVAGCNRHCKGCHNPEAWDYNGGVAYTEEIKNKILDYVKNNDFIKGISLLGGEPLSDCNLENLEEICKEVKELGKDIWCWTGYKYEEVKDLSIMKYIDILIDGEFIEEQRDITLQWRGSSNQRIIKLKELRELN